MTEKRKSQKLTAEALDEQREWLRVTLSSIGDAVITTDIKGCITFLNPAWLPQSNCSHSSLALVRCFNFTVALVMH
ncbi:MAG: hypothetical protein ACR2HX_08040 [Pyrinomonadaceae bacterium]